MQKQTQTCAEKVRQEGGKETHEVHHLCGAYLGLSSLSSRGATQWARERHSDILGQTGTALSNADLRRGTFLQIGQNVQSRHQESHSEHRFSGETAPRCRCTQSNRGRAQVRTGPAHSHGKKINKFIHFTQNVFSNSSMTPHPEGY